MNSLVLRIRARLDRHFRTPRSIASLVNAQDPCMQAIGRATHKTAFKITTPEERRWMERIEQRRDELLVRTDSVSVPDYGAGASIDARSEAEMLAGVMTTELVGEACSNYSKGHLLASLLFHLIREFKPTTGVELGTCLGVSAAYQTAAMELNEKGKLATLEGAAAFGEIAAQGIAALGLEPRCRVVIGRFVDTLPAVMNELRSIDYAFIDGHHDEQATMRYYEVLLPRLSAHALLVFDDIAWSPGMSRAWDHICGRPEIASWVNYGKIGVCWLGNERQPGLQIQL